MSVRCAPLKMTVRSRLEAQGSELFAGFTHTPKSLVCGFTLIEVMMGIAVLVIVIAALLGGFVGQAMLNGHARNLTLAMNDTTRIMEQIRAQNASANCPSGVPSATPPAQSQSWDTWLNTAAGGGKSINRLDATALEVVAVTCQDGSGATPAAYCGDQVNGGNPAQVGTGEWPNGRQAGQNTTFNPIRVTVAIGWRQRQRTIGGVNGQQEFTFQAGATTTSGKVTTTTNDRLLVGPDQNRNGVIDSQAMLTTLVTCR